MILSLRKLVFASAALAVFAIVPQAAFARYICEIKSTKDGFVALRDKPAATGKLITRMKKGEMVGLLHPPDHEKLIRKGNWIYVRYVPGALFAKSNEANFDKDVPGWVNDSLIDCPE